MRNESPVAEFCLRGEIDGIEQTFPLLAGENRVGSLATNEIALPRPGVSREHARLTLFGSELIVEDLGSRNGTFVDGRRVERAKMSLGSRLRCGPVELRFREFHPDDAELAITFEPQVGVQTSVIPVPEPSAGGERWLRLAEAFHQLLASRREGDIGAALRFLQQELRLDSVSVQELPAEGEAVVLAAAGSMDPSADGEIRRLIDRQLAAASGQDLCFDTAAADDGAAISLAAVTGSDADPLVLALGGEFAGREKSESLLRLLVRMLAPWRPRPQPAAVASRVAGYPGLVVPPGYVHAQSAAMRRIYELMQTLAQGDLPILIIGETGVGKEYLARILHDSSPRGRGPFVAINCAAIPAELLEAELFGIGERVATGVAGSKGRLQLASGGTIFLDEIGDMSADLQAKLLRALQEQEVHPVGRDPVSIDVRVLAATNQELRRRIGEGTFRADLYYRLAGYVLEIPPLRRRPEDIPALAERFLRDCARELERPIRGLTVRALKLLTDYPWLGNVRELANEVRRAVYLCPAHGTVESATLSQHIRDHQGTAADEPRPPTVRREVPAPAPAGGEVAGEAADESQSLPAPMGLGFDSLNLRHLEGQAVQEALRRCGQNQVQAAKLLGISRQSLRRRMEKLPES